ncbi:MAG: hypothetical protein JJ896_13500 [Rhodothermales bacterium]|nr:hypothetical protein [Rhodothermales bacterium]MBO6780663.1 hypothetical protein [Rhodothermales bacterium]
MPVTSTRHERGVIWLCDGLVTGEELLLANSGDALLSPLPEFAIVDLRAVTGIDVSHRDLAFLASQDSRLTRLRPGFQVAFVSPSPEIRELVERYVDYLCKLTLPPADWEVLVADAMDDAWASVGCAGS